MKHALNLSLNVWIRRHWFIQALFWIFPIFCFTGLTIIGAQISIPIPGTPVPVTLQTLFVLLSGGWIGPLRGSLSQMLYLFLGVVGIPVFAEHRSGISILVGATGGYLMGFILAPFFIGYLSRYVRGKFFSQTFSLWLGSFIIFGCGLLNLVYLHGVPWSEALRLGFYPFILGDVFKVLLASSLLKVSSSSKHFAY